MATSTAMAVTPAGGRPRRAAAPGTVGGDGCRATRDRRLLLEAEGRARRGDELGAASVPLRRRFREPPGHDLFDLVPELRMRRPRSEAGGSCTWAHSVATSDSRANGRTPARHSYSTQPREYTSARSSIFSPRICSGDTYSIVPTSSPVPVRPEIDDVCFVRPKSVR